MSSVENICLKCAHPAIQSSTNTGWACEKCGAIQSKITTRLSEIEEKLKKLKDPEKHRAFIEQLEIIYKDTNQKQLTQIKELTNLPEHISNLFDELIARRKLSTPTGGLSRATQAPTPVTTSDTERTASDKKILNTLLLCVLFGSFGLHRFYVGKNKSATVQLLITGGGSIPILILLYFFAESLFVVFFGLLLILLIPALIWLFVDFITIILGKFTDRDGNIVSNWQ